MSLEAIEAVLEHSESTGADRLVLLAIASRADEFGRAYPGANDIAARAGANRSTVFRSLKTLVELGELAIDEPGAGRRSNSYRILLPGFGLEVLGDSADVPGGGVVLPLRPETSRDSQLLEGRSSRVSQPVTVTGSRDSQPLQNRSSGDTRPLEGVVVASCDPNTDTTTDRQTDLQSSEGSQLELAGDGGEALDEDLERDAAGLLKQRKKVGKEPVTLEEMQIAVAALKEFNLQSGEDFGLGAHLSMVVMRIRERPSYNAAAHQRLVQSAWRIRWWEKSAGRRRRPTPRVIYGNTDVFENVVQDAIAEKRGRSAEEIGAEATERQRRKYERSKPIDSKVLTKEDQEAAVASLVDMAIQKSEVVG